MISHDVELLGAVCNKIWYLDAVRSEADVYNMGFSKYVDARALDEARRRRERANAEKKAGALKDQAARLGAKATKAAAAKQMIARAERMIDNLDEIRVADRAANIVFPEPAPCGKTPLNAKGLTKMYGSLEVFAGVDLAIDKGSRVVVLGFNGAGKTTLLKLLAGVERTDGEGDRHRIRPQNRLLRPGTRHHRPRQIRLAKHHRSLRRRRPTKPPQPPRILHVLRRTTRPTSRNTLRR